MAYSIIIPIYNEIDKLTILLSELKKFSFKNQIIIIDDGSTDGSLRLLKRNNFIHLIELKYNRGKAHALKTGLIQTVNNKIILFDGDLEINPKDIKKLMILNRKNKKLCVFGNRFNNSYAFDSFWNLGNWVFKGLFNLIYKSQLKDSLCCAKAFYLKDLNYQKLKSNGFDIDIEIAAFLIKKNKIIDQVDLDYKRRNKKQGKKLGLFDTIIILKRIFITRLYY